MLITDVQDGAILLPNGLQNIPQGYVLQSATSRNHNGRPIVIYRYEKEVREFLRLGGEHYSLSVDVETGSLLGLMWMDARFSVDVLPSEQAASAIATAFLSRICPELAAVVELLWVREHSEMILAGGREISVRGMKYKTYRQSLDDYAWVVVGAGGEIITFERDIIWRILRGGRVTEKWLYDDYCSAHASR